ncbi:MAG: YggS family pyridoxal phosphate-dependent enzyme [Puniceicoccaceae bacterium]|nr:MAG: YggS family pyridoxal phosphate-dependent enzyme [Puniceicoccaceae bacterium]
MKSIPGPFQQNLQSLRERVARACDRCGRDPGSIELLPVTKTFPPEVVRQVVEAGLPAVGENRVQEALVKMDAVGGGLRWELIGPLQSNKARPAAERFARIQSVDRVKIVDALARHAGAAGLTLPILLEINAGRDPAKHGVLPEEAEALLTAALARSALRVEGLMTIAPLDEDPAVARRCFAALRECRDRLESTAGVRLPVLSMGMSGDFEAAIEEGSTLIRVGSALFGAR